MVQTALSSDKKRRMDAVMAALEADRSGSSVMTNCPTCHQEVVVTKMPEIGTTVVSCKIGCTSAKFSYKPVLDF